jgi:hypothetical protein
MVTFPVVMLEEVLCDLTYAPLGCPDDTPVSTHVHRSGDIFQRRRWTQPSTTPSPSLAEGIFTVTHPFHPLFGQQFEILTCRHNWGEYRVTFYDTPEHVQALPAVHCLTENLTRRCDLNDIPSRKLCEL